MSTALPFDPITLTVGISRDFAASLVPAQPDPPNPVSGATFGVATMTENAPQGGEMHPDGDEVLYLISVLVTLETELVQRIQMLPRNGLSLSRRAFGTRLISPSRARWSMSFLVLTTSSGRKPVVPNPS
jgi:hypothetical protein